MSSEAPDDVGGERGGKGLLQKHTLRTSNPQPKLGSQGGHAQAAPSAVRPSARQGGMQHFKHSTSLCTSALRLSAATAQPTSRRGLAQAHGEAGSRLAHMHSTVGTRLQGPRCGTQAAQRVDGLARLLDQAAVTLTRQLRRRRHQRRGMSIGNARRAPWPPAAPLRRCRASVVLAGIPLRCRMRSVCHVGICGPVLLSKCLLPGLQHRRAPQRSGGEQSLQVCKPP